MITTGRRQGSAVRRIEQGTRRHISAAPPEEQQTHIAGADWAAVVRGPSMSRRCRTRAAPMSLTPRNCRTPREQCQLHAFTRVVRNRGGCHAPGDYPGHCRGSDQGDSDPRGCRRPQPPAPPFPAGRAQAAAHERRRYRAWPGLPASTPAAARSTGGLSPLARARRSTTVHRPGPRGHTRGPRAIGLRSRLAASNDEWPNDRRSNARRANGRQANGRRVNDQTAAHWTRRIIVWPSISARLFQAFMLVGVAIR